MITTPPLTGTLLPGITRDSLLKLAPELGVKAVEERITTDQWQAECASGELTEVFACGTAAVITPVGRVKGESEEWLVADGEPGPVTMRLREELIGIQYGRQPRPLQLDPQGLLNSPHPMIMNSFDRYHPVGQNWPRSSRSPGRASRMVRRRRQ